MPQLLVRGISPSQLVPISTALIEELAAICQCGTDNFTIDCLSTTSVFGGEQVPTYPFIEVGWFERGQAIQDSFAAALARHVISIGVPEVEIAFRMYQESAYYINGRSCT
ncbi:hypothetical protein Back11_35680 [Paenibacillus baekrokdamisoli]|uniref:Uncharacterized protein n=1 Tax=Paenibacillus baekrokdamisoli TaxID=1712516 RepID=A0A3G9JBD3_9BACL|nr:DUF1904 family protein [Paenibacillus baekrokdamisoli]MBB3070839.1 hypothetical protein [Paenibacillus baekrokdamisoli]BBH22223.1 hypothetical protein Back11_35680 [Paenibacillus baekrokdamisoli]